MAFLNQLVRYRGLILPLATIACIGILLVPMPTFMMDGFLVANIALGMILLLTTMYVKTPREFSVFPTLLVTTSLIRLVLNVGTTRLILTHGADQGDLAAGRVIEAFGSIVAGDMLIVGVVIFAILVLIQFLVITKGATRVSEVAARFALDGLPGKQMAIDADLNSGAIDEHEAQRRRAALADEADFYGTMDGATKFVRGDAIAGICITLVNIIGGLTIGTLEGSSFSESASTFTRLTIGDGLASQIPSFLVSVAVAMLVTRNTRQSNLPVEFVEQLFRHPQAIAVAGGFLCLLMFTNLPLIPMLGVGGACVGLSILINRNQTAAETQKLADEQERKQAKRATAPKPEDLLAVDPLRVGIGSSLLQLAHAPAGGDLLTHIGKVRAGLASELGFLLPQVRLKDNLLLRPDEYEIRLSGEVVGGGRLAVGQYLAVPSQNTMRLGPPDYALHEVSADSAPAVDPLTGRTAYWIPAEAVNTVESQGFQVKPASQVLADHLRVLSCEHASELLTREQTKRLVDQLSKTSPAIVEELIPELLKLSQVQQILQLLLAEDVPIRQLSLILETLADQAHRANSSIELTQIVRNRLARTICNRFSDGEGQLHAIALEPMLQQHIESQTQFSEDEWFVGLTPEEIQTLCNQIQQQWNELGQGAIVLVQPKCRFALREIIQNRLPHVPVLAYSEISLDTNVQPSGTISLSLAAA
ncbi:MAG: flagellar biosynthesis protein FlhA [Pirellulaceae bacterium]